MLVLSDKDLIVILVMKTLIPFHFGEIIALHNVGVLTPFPLKEKKKVVILMSLIMKL